MWSHRGIIHLYDSAGYSFTGLRAEFLPQKRRSVDSAHNALSFNKHLDGHTGTRTSVMQGHLLETNPNNYMHGHSIGSMTDVQGCFRC